MNMSPRIFYPVKLLFRFKGTKENFMDWLQLMEFRALKPGMQEVLKELL